VKRNLATLSAVLAAIMASLYAITGFTLNLKSVVLTMVAAALSVNAVVGCFALLWHRQNKATPGR